MNILPDTLLWLTVILPFLITIHLWGLSTCSILFATACSSAIIALLFMIYNPSLGITRELACHKALTDDLEAQLQHTLHQLEKHQNWEGGREMDFGHLGLFLGSLAFVMAGAAGMFVIFLILCHAQYRIARFFKGPAHTSESESSDSEDSFDFVSDDDDFTNAAIELRVVSPTPESERG
ncbi:uncharacterized protein EI97DRAFT_462925 [Westerdykella ornata]|uniref:Uncharacterized protein n=1 Tax=Westerdykella ornata TaxID=318751 RepID=A0A6A6J449_WESOR|nr:uncharacterized protein EI97DRAFT_462925 [Westerdykella ornata]KAF2271340.1 hypothetical protein EI97DRAFT_462925 [Westerdykella ornata]